MAEARPSITPAEWPFAPTPKRLSVVSSGVVQGTLGGLIVAVALDLAWGTFLLTGYLADGINSTSELSYGLLSYAWFLPYFVIVGMTAGLLSGLAVGVTLKRCRRTRTMRSLRIIAACVSFVVCLVVSLPAWIFYWDVAPFGLVAAAAVAAWRAPDIADPTRN